MHNASSALVCHEEWGLHQFEKAIAEPSLLR